MNESAATEKLDILWMANVGSNNIELATCENWIMQVHSKSSQSLILRLVYL